MYLIAASCYPRIGEVRALKIRNLDFSRKVIYIDASLDYATQKEITTKNPEGTVSVPMTELLERELMHWLGNHPTENSDGYLFVNSKGTPYRSDYIVKRIHKTMAKLGIPRRSGEAADAIHETNCPGRVLCDGTIGQVAG